jgi:hypothetical protein
MAQAVMYPFCKHEVLSSNPTPTIYSSEITSDKEYTKNWSEKKMKTEVTQITMPFLWEYLLGKLKNYINNDRKHKYFP